jgi:prophage antirepressor-like protein
MEPFTSTGVVRQCTPPPKPSPDVPQYGWLLVVYCHDILSRLEDVKARVTSVFGSILKMDSTKKVNVVSEHERYTLATCVQPY